MYIQADPSLYRAISRKGANSDRELDGGDAFVSVIMSAYNSQAYLREAIESILSQTFGNFEFIIVDDGSTDHTWKILSEYAKLDSRVALIRNTANIGLVRSLNKGLALARGEYIARQDADDLSLSTRLQKQVHFLHTQPQVGLIGTKYVVIGERGEELDSADVITRNSEIQLAMLSHNCFCHGSAMFRRSCVERVGSYREAFLAAEDYDLWLRIAEHFEVANLDKVLYRWRFSPGSMTRTQVEEIALADQIALKQAIGRRLGSALPSLRVGQLKPLSHGAAWKLLKNSYWSFLSEDLNVAIKTLRRAAEIEPNLGGSEQLGPWLVNAFVHMLRIKRPPELAMQFVDVVLHEVLTRQASYFQTNLKHKIVAQCYMAAAFQNYDAGRFSQLRRNILQALWREPRRITNPGVLSIGLEAFLGCRTANSLRSLRRAVRPDRSRDTNPSGVP